MQRPRKPSCVLFLVGGKSSLFTGRARRGQLQGLNVSPLLGRLGAPGRPPGWLERKSPPDRRSTLTLAHGDPSGKEREQTMSPCGDGRRTEGDWNVSRPVSLSPSLPLSLSLSLSSPGASYKYH